MFCCMYGESNLSGQIASLNLKKPSNKYFRLNNFFCNFAKWPKRFSISTWDQRILLKSLFTKMLKDSGIWFVVSRDSLAKRDNHPNYHTDKNINVSMHLTQNNGRSKGYLSDEYVISIKTLSEKPDLFLLKYFFLHIYLTT